MKKCIFVRLSPASFNEVPEFDECNCMSQFHSENLKSLLKHPTRWHVRFSEVIYKLLWQLYTMNGIVTRGWSLRVEPRVE